MGETSLNCPLCISSPAHVKTAVFVQKTAVKKFAGGWIASRKLAISCLCAVINFLSLLRVTSCDCLARWLVGGLAGWLAASASTTTAVCVCVTHPGNLVGEN